MYVPSYTMVDFVGHLLWPQRMYVDPKSFPVTVGTKNTFIFRFTLIINKWLNSEMKKDQTL